jgi:hypothetical protein
MISPIGALLFFLETVDIVFLTAAIVAGLIVVLLSNPLTSWVSRLMNRDQKK